MNSSTTSSKISNLKNIGFYGESEYSDLDISKLSQFYLQIIKTIASKQTKGKVKLNAEKCFLARNGIDILSVKWLSHWYPTSCIQYLKEILQFLRLVNETGICAFFSLCGFYYRHTHLFSEIAVSLNQFLK
ncbi:hypothetical protein CLU79DRAFT_858663 [Phycomyces nitens]|nr:hypothetical protein CLU79DRAFT_858663 [Phycomyces nitens]